MSEISISLATSSFSTAPAMAEIFEAPSSSASKVPIFELDFDPETLCKTKPGLKRLILTLTLLFSSVLGLPFLLKSVEIYRSPLPFREIDVLSAAVESNPVYFPCKFQAVFVDFGDPHLPRNDLSISIESCIRKLSEKDSTSFGGCSYNSSFSVVLESSSGCFHSDNGLKW